MLEVSLSGERYTEFETGGLLSHLKNKLGLKSGLQFLISGPERYCTRTGGLNGRNGCPVQTTFFSRHMCMRAHLITVFRHCPLDAFYSQLRPCRPRICNDNRCYMCNCKKETEIEGPRQTDSRGGENGLRKTTTRTTTIMDHDKKHQHTNEDTKKYRKQGGNNTIQIMNWGKRPKPLRWMFCEDMGKKLHLRLLWKSTRNTTQCIYRYRTKEITHKTRITR